MKNLLITTAALVVLAMPAAALDLGNGFTLDNTVGVDYSVEGDAFTTLYEGEVSYNVTDEVRLYAYTDVDLQDVAFTGVDVGAEYSPASAQYLTLTAEAQFDDSINYTDLVLSAELSF